MLFECDCCLPPIAKKLKEYSKKTPFTFSELLRLSHKFTELDEDGSGTLSFQELCTLPELRANPFAHRMCELFSEDGSGQLTFHQFINMMGIFSERTTLESKIVWAFAIWDFDGDDMLGREDITQGLQLITTTNEKTPDSTASTERGGLSITKKTKHENSLTPEEINMVLERIMKEVDPIENGLSFTDFQSVVRRMPDFLDNFRMTA